MSFISEDLTGLPRNPFRPASTNRRSPSPITSADTATIGILRHGALCDQRNDFGNAQFNRFLDEPTLTVHPEKPVSVSRWLSGESIRDQIFRYTAWYDEQGDEVDRMLFDLATDPNETRNIAELPASASVVARMSADLARHRMDSQWSPQLASLVSRMDFANTRTGAVVLAVTVRPILALYGLIPITLLIGGAFVYWRRRRFDSG